MADTIRRPLPPALWARAMAEFSLACAGSFSPDQAERIRDLADLLAQAPDPALLTGLVVPDLAHMEVLVTLNAWESAMLAMLDSDVGYIVSRGGNGQYLASLILPGRAEEVTVSGDSMALALAGAAALALSEGLADYGGADEVLPRAPQSVLLN